LPLCGNSPPEFALRQGFACGKTLYGALAPRPRRAVRHLRCHDLILNVIQKDVRIFLQTQFHRKEKTGASLSLPILFAKYRAQFSKNKKQQKEKSLEPLRL
jgi:hypothetical protein